MSSPNQKPGQPQADEKEGKYLTFALAGETYGINIMKIKEIIGMMPVRSLPQTPEYLKGVVNLRGRVIPVMDLRLRFNMGAVAYDDRTCIIIVEIAAASGAFIVGLVVDSVSEVLSIKADAIETTPDFGTRLDTDYIRGMAKSDGDVKILLNIDHVLTENDFSKMEQAA
ncbi:MAG: chemotaxis protein CheW [Thermodesulfobacteriota bacterium]|nr:chemotaxis protein CheW [Thermodesulfobacteriota bacterium]